MAKGQVFYSFHCKNDVMRAAQIRNIDVIDGNKPVSENEWEEGKGLLVIFNDGTKLSSQ